MVPPELAVSYGLFSVEQARAAGFGSAEIRRRVSRGVWRRVARGVLEATDREPRPTDLPLRAVLSVGGRAALSHASAALMWGLAVPEGGATHVVVPHACSHPRRPRGVLVHRATIGTHELTTVGIVPVTSVPRTLLDLPQVLPQTETVIAMDDALRRSLTTLGELTVDAASRRWSRGAREAVALADPRSGSTEETRARLLFRAAGLPKPQPQCEIVVDGRLLGVADLAWPRHKVVVEIDGFAWHSGLRAFQRDRSRQNEFVLAGWTVLRFTVEDLRLRPDRVVAEVRAALSR